MADWTAAEAFPPGEFIKDELEARGWNQGDLATILGRPLQAVNEILSGRKRITPETACGLAEAFDTSAEMWMNLEGAYRLWLLKKKEEASGKKKGEVAMRRALFERAPVKDMIKRGWIPESSNPAELESYLSRFFGVKILEEEIDFSFAARKTGDYQSHTPSQLAWVFRAKELAHHVGAAKFNRVVFARGLPSLQKLVTHEAAVRHTPKVLADLGVRLVVVEKISGSCMDGAAFWINDGTSPVVAVSFRYDRIDNFWFTLAHECAHVFYGDAGSIDENLVGENAQATEDKPEFEKRADLWARNFLVDNNEIEQFILRVKPLYSKGKINQFANRIKVHPGIIVGQLQRREEIEYWHHREMLVKVKDVVINAAMTDGWGNTPTFSKPNTQRGDL